MRMQFQQSQKKNKTGLSLVNIFLDNKGEKDMRTILIGLNEYCNRVYEFDCATDQESQIYLSQRTMYNYASVVYHNKLIITGGLNRLASPSTTINELFEFKINENTN